MSRITLPRAARPLLACLLASSGCLAVTTPAHGTPAAPAAHTDVTPARFATVDQVARVFHSYRGGRRQVLRSRQISVTDPGDCIAFVQGDVQPRAGKTALYLTRGRESAFFSGGTAVSTTVHEFATPARAQASLDERRASIESCYGTHVDSGYGARWERLAAPELGRDRFAYRSISIDAVVGRDWFVSTIVRTGRFLVGVNLQRDRNAPAAQPAFRLTRICLRSLR